MYRASFTGALKNLLDLTPVEALRGKPVGIVAMGASPHHYLGVDWHLRAMLAWFGALVVPTSVYLESGHFQDGKLVDPAARAALGDLAAALVAMVAQPRITWARPRSPRGRSSLRWAHHGPASVCKAFQTLWTSTTEMTIDIALQTDIICIQDARLNG